MTSNEIRKQFIDFFNSKNHSFIRSSPVVPINDPTLLFTNAGMNQFKPYFLGKEIPENKRVANSQKCIRVSGKHNDLEEVGVDNYHHTFFEMLGNWSFGDYYKAEAIRWSWELLTDIWKLDKNRLWVTIYKDDDETGSVWKQVTDINSDRILKFGAKDNFWEMGETGPCGPCTEIHYYTGNEINNQCPSGVNNLAEYREIWNLVFIQSNRESDGSLSELPEKHVDTGAGFERLVAILNGKESNYQTDLFLPILEKISNVSNKSINFKDGVPHQVIADHLRMLSFSIADGALPSNEGRGYVLRRVLRRASRFGRLLDLNEPFIYLLVPTLVEIMSEAYPELKEKMTHIEKVIKAEELSFSSTLDKGLEQFSMIVSSLVNTSEISGKDAFKLYDTFGFPIDLTQLLAREKKLEVDMIGFEKCMSEQRKLARSSDRFSINQNQIEWVNHTNGDNSLFVGYELLNSKSKIRKYRKIDNRIEVVLDKTPFYAESGGQVGDTGIFRGENFEFEVYDTVKEEKEFIHIGQVKSGNIESIKLVDVTVDKIQREKIRLNHTATHLLHQALKDVLGEHVQQAGSLLSSDRLRFDLTHYEKINLKDIFKIEKIVNNIIRKNIKVDTSIMDYDSAKETGATALFGEKYDNEVRVVDIEGFSKELCGGTHVSQTGEIGMFKIINETALSAGVRRIEAITGDAVYSLINNQENILNHLKEMLKCSDSEILIKINTLLNENKVLEKSIKKFNSSNQLNSVRSLVNSSESVNNFKLIVSQMDEVLDLNELGDLFRQTLKHSGAVLIGTVVSGKPMILCTITDDLVGKLNAGNIVKSIGKIIEGGGGGRPHLATAGGKNSSMLKDALEIGKKNIIEILETYE